MSGHDRRQHGPEEDRLSDRGRPQAVILYITACSDMGYNCYLGQEDGSLCNRITGEVIPLERRDSLYSLKMWVRQNLGGHSRPSFQGPV